MTLILSRIDEVTREYTATVTQPNNQPVTISSVVAALLTGKYETPTGLTEWRGVTFDAQTNVATIRYAGPDVTTVSSAVIQVPSSGGSLWLKVAGGNDVDAEMVERIVVR